MPKKILIVHFGALGDLLLSRPALLSLRRHFLKAKIDFIGYPHLVILLKKELYLNQIYNIENKFFTLFLSKNDDFWQSYDLIIVFSRKFQPEWKNHLRHYIFIKTMPSSPISIIKHQQQQLFRYGIKPIKRFILLNLSLKSKNVADFFIHPGSSSSTKNWPPYYFAKVIEALSYLRVALIIGPADEIAAKEVKRYLKNQNPALAQKVVYIEKKSLLEIAYLLANTSFYAGNDSGISHLAAALGVTSFIIFGPTDVRRWKPWGERITIFRPKLWCAPCDEEKRKRCQKTRCLQEIKPKRVIKRITKTLLL
jgi:ADP-heptose:LPS heptosyltransferase